MIVVFDTNVIIAALIARGGAAEVFEHALGVHDVCTGEFILAEVRDKLRRKFKHTRAATQEVESFSRRNLRVVQPAALEAVCRDPDDDQVLAIAAGAGADVLITGDRDLLVLGSFHAIPIIAPAAFWAMERRR